MKKLPNVQKEGGERVKGVLKNGLILPTGQWYAPPAVINDAWYCMVMHENRVTYNFPRKLSIL